MKKTLLLSLLLFSTATADPKTDRMLEIARQEWKFFGQQTIGRDGKVSHPGHTETEEGYWQRVGTYWKNGVFLSWTGKDTDEAWSAAFMSYVMREAGLGQRFHYSEWHAHYINEAIDGRAEGDDNCAFWGFRLEERSPQVGDLVCYARQDDVDFEHRPEVYKSHCDLVVAVRPGEVDVIGGNVQDSVTLKTLSTDPRGRLIDTNQRWFAILANRLQGPVEAGR